MLSSPGDAGDGDPSTNQPQPPSPASRCGEFRLKLLSEPASDPLHPSLETPADSTRDLLRDRATGGSSRVPCKELCKGFEVDEAREDEEEVEDLAPGFGEAEEDVEPAVLLRCPLMLLWWRRAELSYVLL